MNFETAHRYTPEQVETMLFDGRLSLTDVEDYVRMWNEKAEVLGRFSRLQFSRGNWRSGIRSELI